RAEYCTSGAEQRRSLFEGEGFRNRNGMALPRNNIFRKPSGHSDTGNLRDIAEHFQILPAVFTIATGVVKPWNPNWIALSQALHTRAGFGNRSSHFMAENTGHRHPGFKALPLTVCDMNIAVTG